MKKYFLDCNIYDRIEKDHLLKARIADLILRNKISVICNTTLIEELGAAPFGVPDWFATEDKPDDVFILGHSRLDIDLLGDGKVFDKHKGNSNSYKDAIHAESASLHADYFVTEDKRAAKRYNDIVPNSLMTFLDFKKTINDLF